MKKERLVNRSICSIFVSLLILTSGSTVAQAKSIQLTYSNFFPPSQIQSVLAEAWCKEVEKRTNGEVRIAYYPGQTLTDATQTYDGVLKGLSDIGFSILQYTRGRFPLMDFINLPLGFPNGPVATAIINEVYDKYKPNELSDVKVMYLHAHGPGVIHTKNKPLHTMADIKGMKFRSHGPTAEMIKALGGTPMALPMPELYQALQKGVIQGGVWDFSASYDWKLAEVIDYSTACYSIGYSLGFFVVMNKDKWNSISPESQRKIEEINQEWIIKHGKAWKEADINGINFSFDQGNTINGLEPKEAKNWRKAVQPVVDIYLKSTESKNLPGKDVVEFVEEMLEQEKKGKFKSKHLK
ncbi:MAG: TRAP transporter substrate-binding protein [Desulfobacteraceae bacterium]|jgi:TRAP-type C4-dicarboxylate transport system substrate-binding protein